MKHSSKRLLSILLSLVLMLGLLPGMSLTAYADGDTSYTLTIPSTLTVANSGWNDAGGISVTGTLASGKKLTVTASSANSWALKQQDGNETVSYTMKETSDGAAKTAWEFTALPGSATLGIDVADYSTKPAGTYQDTVTFTASVEDAVPATHATWKLTLSIPAKELYITTSNGEFITQQILDVASTEFTIEMPELTSETLNIIVTDGISNAWYCTLENMSFAIGQTYQGTLTMAEVGTDSSEAVYMITG